MNVKQLETFIGITNSGSFSLAAQQLNTTQSTVSARVRELEQNLGVALFDRSRYRIQLTPKGRELVPYAKQIMQLITDARRRVGDPTVYTTKLRIGIAEMIAITWFPKFLAAIQCNFPKIRVEVDLNLGSRLIQRLRDGNLDLVLTPQPTAASGILLEPLGSVDLAWMASPGLQIPVEPLVPSVVQDLPLIMLAKGANIRRLADAWLADVPLNELITVTHNNISAIAAMTRAGLGISVLPKVAYASDVAAGRLRALKSMPKFPSLELFAVLPQFGADPIAQSIAALARSVNEFRKSRQRCEVSPVPAAISANAIIEDRNISF